MRLHITFLSFSVCYFILLQSITTDAQSFSRTNFENVKTNAAGNIEFVKLNDQSSVTNAAALNWLMNDVLSCNNGDAFHLIKTETDKLGFQHYRYQLYHNNIKVEGAVYYIHTKNGYVVSANGNYFNIKKATQKFKATQALQLAKNYINSKNNYGYKNSLPELVYKIKNNEAVLCYRFLFTDEMSFEAGNIYVNATDGEVIADEDINQYFDKQVTANTHYNGLQTITVDSVYPALYRLQEAGRGGGISTNTCTNFNYTGALPFINTTPNWNDTTNGKDFATDIHYGMEACYDYFYNTFGRNSYNDSGAIIKSYLNKVSYSNGSFFVAPDKFVFIHNYNLPVKAQTSLDRVAHEFVHGVNYNTAFYYTQTFETQSLAESFADMFAVNVNYYKNGITPGLWEVGEQDSIYSNYQQIRSLSNPKQYLQANCYNGQYYNLTYGGTYNSGVSNYWYYLLVNGGSGTNDFGHSYNINGIGYHDAGEIIYRTLSVYLTFSSTFEDARIYSIQSAIDLYGACSNQAIQVANAWNAVNVGSTFSFDVKARFEVSSTQPCMSFPSIICYNQSVNAGSYLWDFGDGNFSTDTNPTHTYSGIGGYNIKLIAYGNNSCSGSDTLIYPEVINITTPSNILPASCFPVQNNPCCRYGITKVKLKNMYCESGFATEGNMDFTCSHVAVFNTGETDTLFIENRNNLYEIASVFFDKNNDGVFQTTEKLPVNGFNNNKTNLAFSIADTFNLLNVPLRLRIIDDISWINTPCGTLDKGQSEDYAVMVVPPSGPPVIDFKSNEQVVYKGQPVQFYALCKNAPTSYQWNFTGANILTSTLKNPLVNFTSTGQYDVTLIASNSFGSDTLTKSLYIEVLDTFSMCNFNFSNEWKGFLFDPGGPNGNYQKYQFCNFELNNPCAGSVVVHLKSKTFNNGTRLAFYDISNGQHVLLHTFFYNDAVVDLTFLTNKISVEFKSNTYGNIGFSLWWEFIPASPSGLPPVADFNVGTVNPALNVPVLFSDTSLNEPVWYRWDFDDGTTSDIAKPKHSFSAPGIYYVKLIVTNCAGSDSITQAITVQQPAIISSTVAAINDTLACGDSVSYTFMIHNNGTGDMHFNFNGISFRTDSIKISAIGFDVKYNPAYLNLKQAISDYVPKYNFYEVTKYNYLTSKPYDALVIPKIYFADKYEYQWMASNMQTALQSGKTIIFCGTDSFNTQTIFETNLWTGVYKHTLHNDTSAYLQVSDYTTPLTQFLSSPFNPHYNVHCLKLKNPDKQTIINYFNSDVVAMRKVNTGKVIYLGYDFSTYNNIDATLLSNALLWSKCPALPTWANITLAADTLPPGDSDLVTLTLSTKELAAGFHYFWLILNSNDFTNPVDSFLCRITVLPGPKLTADSNCVDFHKVKQFATKTDSVIITNAGCSNLKVDSIVFSSSYFSCFDKPLLLPYESKYLHITFNSNLPGLRNDTAIVYSTGGIKFICLSAFCDTSPVMEIMPDSVEASLFKCNDTLHVPVNITNVNGKLLRFTTRVPVMTKNKVRVSFLTCGAVATSVSKIRNCINAHFTNYTFNVISTTNADSLYDKIDSTDVIIIPQIVYALPAVFQAFAPVLNAFVNAGGEVIFLSSTSAPQIDCIFKTGLLSGNIPYGWVSSKQFITANNTTLLTYNIPYTITFSNSKYFYPLNITNSDTITILRGNYGNFCVMRYQGAGKVIYIAITYENQHVPPQFKKLLSNAVQWSKRNPAVQWIDVNKKSGHAYVNDTIPFKVMLSNSGLAPGLYKSAVTIASNDELQPYYSLMVTMHNEGLPELTPDKNCMNFYDVMQFTSEKKEFVYTNTGCDTLRIDSAKVNSPYYNIMPSKQLILPDDTGSVLVKYLPQLTGNFIDSLFIYSNAGMVAACIKSSVYPPPVISVNTDTIKVNLTSCTDADTIFIKVKNTGPVDLKFNLNGLAYDTVKVLVMANGPDYYHEYLNTLRAMSESFDKYSIYQSTSFNANILQQELAGKDICLAPEMEYGIPNQFTQIKNTLDSFMRNGGTVVFCGQGNGASNCLFNTKVFSGTWQGSITSGNLQFVNDLYPISESLPAAMVAGHNTHLLNITNADKIPIYKRLTNDVVTWRKVGKGKAIYIAFDYQSYNTPKATLIANAVRWSGSRCTEPWMAYSQKHDTLATGDSILVPVIINANSLTNGTYNYELHVNSNDPLHPENSIPVEIKLQGEPAIAFRTNCIQFDTTMQHVAAKDTLWIKNTGCDTLHISNMFSATGEIYTQQTTIDILPYDSLWLFIYFKPSLLQTYNTVFFIKSNVADTQICIQGVAYPPPVLNFSPNNFTVNIPACTDSVSFNLNVSNIGQSKMYFGFKHTLHDKLKIGVLEYPQLTFQSLITQMSLNSYNQNYEIAYVNSYNIQSIKMAMDTCNVFFIQLSSVFNNYPGFYNTLIPELHQYVKFGGQLVFASPYQQMQPPQNYIFKTELFEGSQDSLYWNSTIHVSQLINGLTDNLPTTFPFPYNSLTMHITDTDKVMAVDINGSDLVTFRNLGYGRVVYAGFGNVGAYYQTEVQLLNANLSTWSAQLAMQKDVNTSYHIDTIEPGLSGNAIITIHTKHLQNGLHTYSVPVYSNDPLHAMDSISISINVGNEACADFEYQNNYCNVFGVAFTSDSINNPLNWQWTFGDGNSSTQQHPVHTYAAPGYYNVKLVTCNATNCDSVEKVVFVPATSALLPASCTPLSLDTSFQNTVGIIEFNFNTIHNKSDDATAGYEDFTCTHSTAIKYFQAYPVEIITSINHIETVRVLIDLNNDGILSDFMETVFFNQNNYFIHNGTIIINSVNTVFNTPLRMRVMSDVTSFNTCSDLTHGQAEDYTVIISQLLGSDELAQNNGIQIYPNPATDKLNLTLENNLYKKLSVKVYSITGEKISELYRTEKYSGSSLSFNISSITSGIYFVEVSMDDVVYNFKFVKM